MPREYTYGFNVRLTDEQAQAVERHADRRGISASAALREILDEGVTAMAGTSDHQLELNELADSTLQAAADRQLRRHEDVGF